MFKFNKKISAIAVAALLTGSIAVSNSAHSYYGLNVDIVSQDVYEELGYSHNYSNYDSYVSQTQNEAVQSYITNGDGSYNYGNITNLADNYASNYGDISNIIGSDAYNSIDVHYQNQLNTASTDALASLNSYDFSSHTNNDGATVNSWNYSNGTGLTVTQSAYQQPGAPYAGSIYEQDWLDYTAGNAAAGNYFGQSTYGTGLSTGGFSELDQWSMDTFGHDAAYMANIGYTPDVMVSMGYTGSFSDNSNIGYTGFGPGEGSGYGIDSFGLGTTGTTGFPSFGNLGGISDGGIGSSGGQWWDQASAWGQNQIGGGVSDWLTAQTGYNNFNVDASLGSNVFDFASSSISQQGVGAMNNYLSSSSMNLTSIGQQASDHLLSFGSTVNIGNIDFGSTGHADTSFVTSVGGMITADGLPSLGGFLDQMGVTNNLEQIGSDMANDLFGSLKGQLGDSLSNQIGGLGSLNFAGIDVDGMLGGALGDLGNIGLGDVIGGDISGVLGGIGDNVLGNLQGQLDSMIGGALDGIMSSVTSQLSGMFDSLLGSFDFGSILGGIDLGSIGSLFG